MSDLISKQTNNASVKVVQCLATCYAFCQFENSGNLITTIQNRSSESVHFPRNRSKRISLRVFAEVHVRCLSSIHRAFFFILFAQKSNF